MGLPRVTQMRANVMSIAIILIGIGALMFWGHFWPWILLVIGSSLVVRQWLRGRHYDMAITTFVFGGLFLYYFTDVAWATLMPVLFVTGGIYLIFREWFVAKRRFGREKIEDVREEIEEQSHKR